MGNTANNNWPYPESTDLVKDGATAIENLADAIDTTLGVFVPSNPGLTLINTTSFSAVASQSLPDNVFSATYENYRLIVNITSASADAIITFKMRASGTDSSTGYKFAGLGGITDVSSTNNGTASGTAGLRIMEIDGNTTESYSFAGDLFNPFLAQKTRYAGVLTDTSSGGLTRVLMQAGVHTVATSFDSITLIPSAGNITGKAYIYGYSF